MENHSTRSWPVRILLLLSIFIGASNASIHDYRNEKFIPQANARFFHGGSEGLYASNSQHLNTSSSDTSLKGKSFIRFDDVTFVRTTESASKQNPMQSTTGLVEAIILEVKDRHRIGGSSLKNNAICCTPDLADAGSCTLGEVIIKRDSEWPRQIKTFFKGNKTEVTMSPETVVINKTGMYYLYFMICDPGLDGSVIRGRTVWKNPDGYLPGKVAPLMKFFGFMSLAYLLLGLVWFLRFVKFWKDIIQLHYHITLVIALGMCEMAVRYFEYANFDSTGMRPMDVTLWAVTFGSVKKTLSRLLLLVVSMGFGVVKPTLGGMSSRVLLLGVVYFVATEGLELVEHLGNINDFSGKSVIYLVIPVAILDACFILWIFSSLARTLEKLQVRETQCLL
ncbi:Lung seven transmembrane receptor family protein [Hirschfeldia incana]|nr:Lung seven transmembrane receptor family protein [Hirschfeldia incana]